MEAQIDKLVREIQTSREEIETLEEEIKECTKLPEGHNERLCLAGLDAQLGAVLGEELLLMQQLQGAMPALCATHELCLLLLCVPHTSACKP